jgi:hypothetical protein
MPNFVLAFEADGTFSSWIPGYTDPESRPYAVDEKGFTGWFGFSNDRHGRRGISFPVPDRMELEFPDGSVASFRRLGDSAEPLPEVEARCVLFTVRGEDYDPGFVASAKRKKDDWDRTAEIPERLVGEWITMLGEGTDESVRVELVLREDRSAKLTSYFLADRGIPPAVVEGALFVDGDWMITSALSCGAAMRFDLDGEQLRITADGSHHFEFERSVHAE